MTGRRSSTFLALVATVIAVSAVALTATLVAGGGARPPKVLHLANAGTAATGARDSAINASGGAYRLTGELPKGKPADAAAWTLPTGPGPAGPVARLASALKAGTPVREGKGWRAGGLHVAAEPSRAWHFYPCRPETPVASGAPVASDSAVACATSSGTGYGGAGSVSGGSSGSGSTSDTGPGTVTSGSAVPGPVRLPVQRTPTKEQVRAAAGPVLAAVGLSDAAARVTAFPGSGSVVVDPVVGALQTYAWTTRVDVDEHGRVTGGNGWLGTPVKADTYPLVTAREAFDNLPAPPRILSCEVTPSGACKQPPPTEITGAHLGLTVSQLMDGGELLVPAWLFDVKGSPDPVAGVAVETKYLGSLDQPSTEPATGKPTQGEPVPSFGTPQPTNPRSQVAFDSAYRATTANAVVVQYGDSGSCPHKHLTHAVKEDAGSVYVVLAADAMDPKTACTLDYRAMKVTVALQAPLGNRNVIDSSTGRKITVS